MFQKTWPILTIMMLLAAAGAVSAQEDQTPMARLVHFDDSFEIVITDSEGFEIYADYGIELPPGSQIVTKQSSAEIRLEPNGTIIRLAPQSDFTVKTLQGRDSEPVNQFALAAGKLRAVAARAAGGENRYSIDTPAAVCGVRGTDFGLAVQPEQSDSAFVKEGKIDFTSKRAEKTISLSAGQAADAFSSTFEPISLSPAQMSERLSGLDFQELSPSTVPGQTRTSAEEEPAEEEEPAASSEPAKSASAQPAGDQESAETDKEEAKEKAKDSFLSDLGNFLGMEMGTTTINDTVYSKLVLQPRIQIGKLDTVLYLPVIYSSNMFDPDDWYKPAGNYEWSFGSDQDDALDATADFARDLALKFRYLQYGDPAIDNFFFGIGNLNTMTIGHGILMRDYANDADFPAVRKLGVNFRGTGSRMGIEGVSDDLTDIDILGSRVFFRPIKDTDLLTVGFSSVVDLYPAGDLPDPEAYGDPLFVSGAADVELFKINTDAFDLMGYVDGGAMLPIYRTSPGDDVNGDPIGSGPALDAVLEGTSFRNYGVLAGVQGKMTILNWMLEYRYYEGTFKPSFFGPDYDRRRASYVNTINTYLKDPSNPEFDTYNMGIYGQGDFTLLDHITFTGGYFWPWTIDAGGDIQFSYDDSLKLSLALEQGLLPIDVHGSVSYERSRFVETLAEPDKDLNLFDSNTIFTGELIYPVSPTLDLAFLLSTAAVRDSEGNIQYRADGVTPEITPTVDIETRLSF